MHLEQRCERTDRSEKSSLRVLIALCCSVSATRRTSFVVRVVEIVMVKSCETRSVNRREREVFRLLEHQQENHSIRDSRERHLWLFSFRRSSRRGDSNIEVFQRGMKLPSVCQYHRRSLCAKHRSSGLRRNYRCTTMDSRIYSDRIHRCPSMTMINRSSSPSISLTVPFRVGSDQRAWMKASAWNCSFKVSISPILRKTNRSSTDI